VGGGWFAEQFFGMYFDERGGKNFMSGQSQDAGQSVNGVGKNSAAPKPADGPILDGRIHVTHNADGTTTSYQGTVGSEVKKTDANGNVTITGTATVTTQTLNAHGDIVSTTTTTATRTLTADSKGKVSGSSSFSQVGVADNTPQAQSMRSNAITFWQMNLGDVIPLPKGVQPALIDHLNFTVDDTLDVIKAFGEGAQHGSYACAKAGINCN